MAKASRSYKTEIIERLFQKRWNANAKQLQNPVVRSGEVVQEHADYRTRRGEQVETINAYAFMKDLLRSKTRNRMWPRSVFEAGYTGRQVTGGSNVFEFITVPAGQPDPFPDAVPPPPEGTPVYSIASIGLPLASRRLGRADESWLLQVSVRLHILETFFALFSSKRDTIRQIDHLQNGLKLRLAEIDALFLGIEEPKPGRFTEFLITCEVKSLGQDLIVEQILQQVRMASALENVPQTMVVPTAIRAVGPSRVQVVEFSGVQRSELDEVDALDIVNQAVFVLVPAMPGIGVHGVTRKRTGGPLSASDLGNVVGQ